MIMNIRTIDDIYPLTIVMDRYTGAYSGGLYTAWNLDFYDVPKEIEGDDSVCHSFWHDNKIICGLGNEPISAANDLLNKLTHKP